MEDYNKVLEATEVSQNANGVAAEKMTVYNESLEAAQNRLTASVQQFAQDSNLDRTLALAYDGLSKVVEILNILLNKIPVLSPLIKALGAALAAAFGAKMIGSIKAVTSAVSSIGAAASSATAILTTTAVTIGSFAVPVWGIVAAITAIAGAVKLVVKTLKDNTPEQKAERSKKALEESNAELDETNSKIQEVKKQIDDINSKGTLTLADEAEKQRLQEQLDLLEEIKKTQEAINKEKSAQALSDEQAKAKKITTYNSEDVSQYQTGLQSTQNYATAISTGNINELIAAYQQLEKEKKNLNSADEDYAEQLKTNEQLTSSFTTKLLEQKQSYLDEMKALSDLGDTSSETYKALQQAVDMINVTLDSSNFETLKVQNLIDTSGLEDKIKESVQAGDEAGDKMATAYAKSFAKKIQDDDSMKNAWAQAMAVDPSVLDNVDVLTKEIYAKFQQMYGNISDGYNEVVQNVFSKTDVVNAYATILDKVNDKTEILTKAYKQLTKQGSLSTDVVQKLTEAYPELSKQLDFTSGKITLNVEVLKKLYNAEYESAEATVKAEIEKTKATIEGVRARISALEQERQALLKTLDAGVESGRDEAFYEKQYRLLEAAGTKANANLSEAESHLDNLNALLGLVQNTARTGLGSGVKDSASGSKSSGKSAAQKAAKEFEDSIKDKVKNLKSIVQLYSENANWDDPTVIKEFQDRYDKILNKVINDPKARKVLADAFNLDISNMPVEQQIQELTTLWQKQAGTIQESYQKLLKNLAKEDLSSAKAVIEKYKNGIYGAWSSDEALNAAKADYQKFIDKITNDADYRAAMAEALNLGDISGEPVEKQVEAVINALLKSTGTLDDAQQDLYDDASKNIKALQDEIEDMIDTAIGLLEKAGDFLFDMLDKISDRYDAQIDNLDKISDELDDQKDAFEDKIDQQKELLKLQKEEMDNADELAEKNKSIADIDAQLMELQYDNSAEAQAKRLKLLDERAQKEKDLADWQKDNDYDIKIDALDKEKSEYEKTIEAEKKAIEAQKQTLQDAQKQFETTLGNIKNGFDTFIKILSSDLVKNLISKALINTGSDTVTKLLTGYNKLFGTGIDSDVTGTVTKGFKSLKDTGKELFDGFDFSKSITNTSFSLNKISKLFGDFSGGIKQIIQPGISFVAQTFNGLGNTVKNAFKIDWGGIGSSVEKGIQVIPTVLSKMFNPVAKGAASIGDAIGSGIIGFFPGIFSALGTLVTTVGTAMSGVLEAIGTTMASIPVVGWVIAAAALGGAVALGATILSIANKTKSSKVTQPTQSFLPKKHHSGADYVKKENPTLDKMLGLNDDETVSILHVGEAVVPAWANNASSSASGNRFTGSPFSSAVDSAVKSARVSNKTYSNSDNSSINISMPINIQGDADISTVNSLKKEADNIVNRVLKTINNQTRIGGYKNIKAATV